MRSERASGVYETRWRSRRYLRPISEPRCPRSILRPRRVTSSRLEGEVSLFRIGALIAMCATALALAIVTAARAADARALSSDVTVCPGFTGPMWDFSTTKGTKYSLETSGGYKCSLATTWVKKLAAKKLPGTKENTHFPIAGPAGFTCEASPDSKGHAFTGSAKSSSRPAPRSLASFGRVASSSRRPGQCPSSQETFGNCESVWGPVWGSCQGGAVALCS